MGSRMSIEVWVLLQDHPVGSDAGNLVRKLKCQPHSPRAVELNPMLTTALRQVEKGHLARRGHSHEPHPSLLDDPERAVWPLLRRPQSPAEQLIYFAAYKPSDPSPTRPCILSEKPQINATLLNIFYE